jgi:hypothetical protein
MHQNPISQSRQEARQRLSNVFHYSRPLNKKKLKPVYLHKDSTPTDRLEWIKQTAGNLAEIVTQRELTLEDLKVYQSLLDKSKEDKARQKYLSRTTEENNAQSVVLVFLALNPYTM